MEIFQSNTALYYPSLTPLRYIFVCGSLKRVKKKRIFLYLCCFCSKWFI